MLYLNNVIVVMLYIFRLDSKPRGRSSVGSDPKAAADSDSDSMAEYGEGDTGNF